MTIPADQSKTDTSQMGRRPRRPAVLPYVIVLALLGYGVFWLAARGLLEARIGRQADLLRRAGYSVALAGQRVDGFPFRLRLHYDRMRLVAPSGWGVDAPGIDAQAFIYAPYHWVIVAPDGLEVERGRDGPLAIRGDALRASVVRASVVQGSIVQGSAGDGWRAPWRLALEGEALRFSTTAPARPFTLARADRFDALLRPAPDGSGGQLLVRLTNAFVAPSSALAPIARAKPLALDMAVRFTKPDAFKGAVWASAVQAWTQAGGEAQVVRLRVDAGPGAVLSADRGALAVGEDGRLAGAVPLHLVLPSSLAVLPIVIGGHVSLPVRIVAIAIALVRGAGGALDTPLKFQAGRTVLEGFVIGPAPEVYRPAAAVGQAKPARRARP